MPDRILHTRQGQAWDQFARAEYGTEKHIHNILRNNDDEADVVLFSGDICIVVPQMSPAEQRQEQELLPPWERL